MKKNISTILILSFILFSQLQLFSQQKNNHNRSYQLIQRFNKLRINNKLSIIQHDTILDNVSMEIGSKRKFRNSMGLFYEDSIRSLLYRKGVIDYQYEVIEVLDKDITSGYASFLLNDRSDNLRIGVSKKNNRSIFCNTKRFIKFDHWEGNARSEVVDFLHSRSKSIKLKVYTDSLKCYLKTIKQGNYMYYTSDLIPLKSDKMVNITKKPFIIKSNNKLFAKYDLVITLRDKECSKYLIVVDENNERVAILK